MANKRGNAYGLTVFFPILPHGPQNSQDGVNGQTFAALIRYELQRVGCNDESPMAQVPNTYLARFFVLNDVVHQGKPAHLEHLNSNYLVFSSNFHGELEPYLEGMWNAIQDTIQAVLQYCVGFENVRDAPGFVEYIKKCQVTTTFYFSGSTEDSLAEQLKGLYIKQELSAFAYENQGKPAAELQAAFREFMKRTQPENLAGPTWKPGAHRLEDAVVETYQK